MVRSQHNGPFYGTPKGAPHAAHIRSAGRKAHAVQSNASSGVPRDFAGQHSQPTNHTVHQHFAGTAERLIAGNTASALLARATDCAHPLLGGRILPEYSRWGLPAQYSSFQFPGMADPSTASGLTDRDLATIRPFDREHRKFLPTTFAAFAEAAELFTMSIAAPRAERGAVWVQSQNPSALHRLLFWHYTWPRDASDLSSLVSAALDLYFTRVGNTEDFPIVDIVLHDPSQSATADSAVCQRALQHMEHWVFQTNTQHWMGIFKTRPPILRVHTAAGTFVRLPAEQRDGIYVDVNAPQNRFAAQANPTTQRRLLRSMQAVHVVPAMETLLRGTRGIHPDCLLAAVQIAQPGTIGRRLDTVVPRHVLVGQHRTNWWTVHGTNVARIVEPFGIALPARSDGVITAYVAAAPVAAVAAHAIDIDTAGVGAAIALVRRIADEATAITVSKTQSIDNWAAARTAEILAIASRGEPIPPQLPIEIWRELLIEFADTLLSEISVLIASMKQGVIIKQGNIRREHAYAGARQLELAQIQAILSCHSRREAAFFFIATVLATTRTKTPAAATQLLPALQKQYRAWYTLAIRKNPDAKMQAGALTTALINACALLDPDVPNPKEIWHTFILACAAVGHPRAGR